MLDRQLLASLGITAQHAALAGAGGRRADHQHSDAAGRAGGSGVRKRCRKEPFCFAEDFRTIRLTRTPDQAPGRAFAFSVDSKGFRRSRRRGRVLCSETEKMGSER